MAAARYQEAAKVQEQILANASGPTAMATALNNLAFV